MGSICGIIFKTGVRAEKKFPESMLKAMNEWKPEKTYSALFENAMFGGHYLSTKHPEKNESNLVENDGYIFMFDGRMDKLQTRSSRINEALSFKNALPETFDFNQNTKEIIFQTETDKLQGDFVMSCWDKHTKELRILRDHFGKRPLFYIHTEEYFAFATEMKAFFNLPGFSAELDDAWIADCISTVKSEKNRSPYKNIHRLLPGHQLIFENNSLNIQPYWKLEVNPSFASLTEDEAVNMLSSKLKSAVDNILKNTTSIGSELSGGLDSSAVTAMAWEYAKSAGTPFYALSNAFADDDLGKFFPYEDEREFSNALIDHCKIPNHIFCTASGKGILETLRNTIHIQSGPVQEGFNIFSDSLYENAREKGVKILLSGSGGDEGVSYKGGGYLEELSDKKQWGQFKKQLIGKAELHGKNVKKAQLKYYIERYAPFSLTFIQKLKNETSWQDQKFEAFAFNAEFGKKYDIRKRFTAWAADPVDRELRKRQYLRVMHDYIPMRMEYSYLAGLYHKFEYAYPLWDVDLVEFHYSMPSAYKMKNGQGRYAFRQSLVNIVPEKVRLRNDKTGTTIPTVTMRIINDYDNIIRLIKRASLTNKFHYLDYEKMLVWAESIKNTGQHSKKPLNLGAFINSLQVLLIQEQGLEHG